MAWQDLISIYIRTELLKASKLDLKYNLSGPDFWANDLSYCGSKQWYFIINPARKLTLRTYLLSLAINLMTHYHLIIDRNIFFLKLFTNSNVC